MRVSRRVFLTTASLVAVEALLAACGGSTSAPTTATSGAPSSAPSVAPTTAATRAATAAAGASTAPTGTGVATVVRTGTAVTPSGTATRTAPAAQVGGEVVIYSARKEELMKPLVDAFTVKTGVKVTLKSGGAGELATLIDQEKGSPRGDVFFTTDAASAEGLRQKGLFEPYVSPNAASVPTEFKATEGGWTGVIGRSRNIIYNTDLVKSGDAPKSVFELTDAKYKGKVAMASIREGSVRLWLDSLVQIKGEEFTTKYINDLLANGLKVLPNHTEVSKAVASGEYAFGLTNHYYYAIEKNRNQNVPLGLIYPDQGPNDIGTLVIPLSVSVIKGAKNQAAARAFVDFALSPDGQLPLTTQENEFPLTVGTPLGAASAPGVRTIGEIKRPTIDFAKLAEIEKRVVEIFTPLLGAN